MELPSYDLHCHSTASDGTLTSAELLEHARKNNIDILALTDHDTIAGILSLTPKDKQNITLINGTELSCLWGNCTLHIIGLGFDINCPTLVAYFDNLAEIRIKRAKKIAAKLVKLGFPDLMNQAYFLAEKGNVGRPHFARALVNNNLITSEKLAFDKYLGTGKKADVKIEWPSLQDAISTIKNAGGIAVLAHPTKYKMTFTKVRRAIHDFSIAGGEGIEVSYPGIKPEHQSHLLNIAKTYNLRLSAGSDFHSPKQPWHELGKFPSLKLSDNHIIFTLTE